MKPLFPKSFDGDFVILGGGLCGCLLAERLCHRGANRVWVIEAGTIESANRSDSRIPARWLHLLGSQDDWQHETEPIQTLAGRRLMWPRGRGLGGSSRINAMIWMPPQPEDHAMLVKHGLDHARLNKAKSEAESIVQPERARWLSDAGLRFVEALKRGSGVGKSGNTAAFIHAYARMNRRGQRWTSASLLHPYLGASDQAPIRLIHAAVERLHLANDAVVAISLSHSGEPCMIPINGSTRVISCLGALGSPGMMLQSGIGLPRQLPSGMSARLPLNGVGENLHDHLVMPVIFRVDIEPFSGQRPSMQEFAAWQHGGTGRLVSNLAECGGFDPSRQFQLHVTPTDYLRYPASSSGAAITLAVNLTCPKSRGAIRLAEYADETPQNAVRIDAGYLSDERDVAGLTEGIMWARELAATARQSGFNMQEILPGDHRESAAKLAAAITRYGQTLYHPGGTCSLGDVVEASFSVAGLANLSVVDASVLPQPTMGNPSATLAMLACYAASRLSSSATL